MVVTTYELLPAAVYLKKKLGFKLVYDVQENYSLNIKFNQTLPNWLGRLLSRAVSYIEKRAFKYVDHFLLAERCYQKELDLRDAFTILENKTTLKPIQVSPFQLSPNRPLTFVISGTLTPIYGVEEAVNWFILLNKEAPHFNLSIVGHVPMQSFRRRLLELVEGHPHIHHELSSTPLPYPQITKTVSMADLVLMPYQQIASIRYKIPTKLYESLALSKPIIHAPNPLWKDITAPYSAALELDFLTPPTNTDFLSNLHTHAFYKISPSTEVTWSQESTKWILLVDNLLG
ncbi:hypothetical protein KIH41_02605 [Litoribacter ruber]|uniref:hypothetical protein n=1 Tax=Litoribacter ruber TaxID=702568 RepID=UPI001BD9ECD5|nr:hypothetical protein [Litoribacter ruber]MBT0810171.1 hypothetical protein [Litoribacter ruber]